jgi:hypothetical protein
MIIENEIGEAVVERDRLMLGGRCCGSVRRVLSL